LKILESQSQNRGQKDDCPICKHSCIRIHERDTTTFRPTLMLTSIILTLTSMLCQRHIKCHAQLQALDVGGALERHALEQNYTFEMPKNVRP